MADLLRGGAGHPSEQARSRPRPSRTRLLELELHHVDLDTGYLPSQRPGSLRDAELAEPLRTQRRDRSARVASRPMWQLLLVSGSLRSGSTNTAVLSTVPALGQDDMCTSLYAGLAELPAFHSSAEPRAGPLELRALVVSTDAVLVGTPEYAGALPGSLKNALEWLVGGGEMDGRPVGWLTVSSVAAPSGGRFAHDELGRVLGYLGADVVPDACRTAPMSRTAVDDEGLVNDRAVRQQLAIAVRALARCVAAQTAATSGVSASTALVLRSSPNASTSPMATSPALASPRLERHLLDRSHLGVPGVVDEHVERAVGSVRGVDARSPAGVVGHVVRQDMQPACASPASVSIPRTDGPAGPSRWRDQDRATAPRRRSAAAGG